MTELPIFPLERVLMPGMPLALRVFEDRYLELLRDLSASGQTAFGVVLIERGREVGGDARFTLGTLCRVAIVEPRGGLLAVVGRGTRRFEVLRWLPDDPYPRGEVRLLPDLLDATPLPDAAGASPRPDVSPTADAAGAAWVARAERAVRRGLARASEFADTEWPAAVTLPGEGAELLWRLAGVAAIGELDRQALLAARTVEELAARLIEAVEDAGSALGLSDAGGRGRGGDEGDAGDVPDGHPEGPRGPF